jgi:glycosyltransferase involved in cell wall biosynthesis
MPTTAERRAFVLRSITYFVRQDYKNKELLIVDEEPSLDLPFSHPQIRRITLPSKRTLGAKRNFCVEAARGDLIMHWDDDDWMAPHRISYQVASLLREGAEVCGLQRMLFYQPATGEVWLYEYPDGQQPWLAGGSLLYTKDFWRRAPFPNVQVASDTRFVWAQQLDKRAVLADHTFYVALIHPGNTSQKNCAGPYWTKWSGDLETVMGSDLAFHTNGTAPPVAISETNESPAYTVLMAVHNALEMTRLATLQTLRHLRNHDARLVVVDNGSNDGTETWLQMLAERGDIDLIRSDKNLGHGPALELARKHTTSPYLVTLDSDAFPLREDWLPQLRGRLNERTKVAGIRHHRDYIHPSCLLIARETLDHLNLSFLNEKDRATKYDVAERISVDLKAKGYTLAGLERTAAQRRGSASEPVYLGSEYEGLVHHQWYTTRAVISGGHQVDDVSNAAIDNSLAELFARFDKEARELTVVVGLRSSPDEPQRLTNALICLRALNVQDLERERYRIVVVEQDEAPKLQNTVAPYIDNYVFAYNAGPYNRGWAFNIGAALPAAASGVLCLIDADLLIGPDFLRRCLENVQGRRAAVLPYDEVVYLDAAATGQVVSAYVKAPLAYRDATAFHGRVFSTSQGGCIWIDAGLYRDVDGHNERFRGWGREDRDFCRRVEKVVKISRLKGRLLHLYHPRPAEDDKWARLNQQLFDELTRTPERQPQQSIGNPELYRSDVPAHVAPQKVNRDWENWHTWSIARIEKIVNDERRRQTSTSQRRKLAMIVGQFGNTLLDVGCGPGPLWPRLENQSHLHWVGLDVTHKMIATAHRLFPNVPCLRADAGRLPFNDAAFEVVLLRHVLEHLPHWLMENVISEATRVAKRAVVIDFYIPPPADGPRSSQRVGGNFIETRWTVDDVKRPVSTSGWTIEARLSLGNGSENDRIWILLSPAEVAAWRPNSDAIETRGKISIIMPTYHRGHAILRTVRRIQKQTYQNWELIIIDNDGETDYQFDDPRIQVHTHAERASSSYARNAGLQYVSGDLVCFFDDDDDMFPNYLETFASTFAANPRAKLVRCGMIVSGGAVNFSYATPECCLRSEFATADWCSRGPAQDQRYFRQIIETNKWSEDEGEIVTVREPLCRANTDALGGLRSGSY